MNVRVLDCTLRDGGYCNQWNFGYNNIISILNSLNKSTIDIIECGFITNKIKLSKNDLTKYNSFIFLDNILKQAERNADTLHVAMINFGEYNLNEIPYKTKSLVDGIRVAFHKADVKDALEFCNEICKKGYKVFLQPMLSISYSDDEFNSLIENANRINPYAFYIVDSFGNMNNDELRHYYELINSKLNHHIVVGFHSHNNLQLAFANAQTLIEIAKERDLIIDSSLYGMGRGAGNLNTELLTGYLNRINHNKYIVDPLLKVIDEVLSICFKLTPWGYSLPNYLSAIYNIHPSYALYLTEKNTLTVEDINNIFKNIESDKIAEFDKSYIENLYIKYLNGVQKITNETDKLINEINGKKILLVAPGKSIYDEREKIYKFLETGEVKVISINFAYENADFVFISNLRRFKQFNLKKLPKTIITSNIPFENSYITIEYKNLLNDEFGVCDNAGLMLIKLLINLGVNEVWLAGMDGYGYRDDQNYFSKDMVFFSKNSVHETINNGMNVVLNGYQKLIKINFLTTPRYVKF